MRPNEATLRLLLRFEVGGGEEYYNRLLRSPTWPGEASGVTIGVGYDLGYNSAETIRREWSPHLNEQVVGRLARVAGLTGARARAALGSVRDIIVPWSAAFAVFEAVTIPKFWEKTRNVFPGVEELHPNCQGALLSLVFNRGESLAGDRRREMRAIRASVTDMDYREIARQIRLMKRLWRGTTIERGMSRRRDSEADLVLSAIET
jgi:hypothetical protein